MPIYVYSCSACNAETELLTGVGQAPDQLTCERCGSGDTRRIIAGVAYHTSEARKTAKLDPRYERMVDHAMNKSASADENRLFKKMKPFPGEK